MLYKCTFPNLVSFLEMADIFLQTIMRTNYDVYIGSTCKLNVEQSILLQKPKVVILQF